MGVCVWVYCKGAYWWCVRVCDVRVGCVRCRRVYWGVWVCMVLEWGVCSVGGCIGVCGCVCVGVL